MPARHLCLMLLITVVLFDGAALSAQAKQKDTYLAGNCITGSPAPKLCPAAEANTQSWALACQTPGAFVIRGYGDSMLPLYRSGTLLVVQPVPFEKLRRGMSVVFQHEGRSITHLLVAKAGKAWRTTGLNNRRQDYVAVDERNIRGVVIAAFTPLEGSVVTMR